MPDLDGGWRAGGGRGLDFRRVPSRAGKSNCYPRSPELCVEVLSPANREEEMQEKVGLYFDTGAQEAWLCAADGRMRFLGTATGRSLRQSRLYPQFPLRVELR